LTDFSVDKCSVKIAKFEAMDLGDYALNAIIPPHHVYFLITTLKSAISLPILLQG